MLVWEVINFCKKEKIPTGIGRGSAAGSLLLYLMGVTKIDPLQYDLYFEPLVVKPEPPYQCEDCSQHTSGTPAPHETCWEYADLGCQWDHTTLECYCNHPDMGCCPPGDLNLDSIIKVEKTDFINRVCPVYKSLNLIKNSMDYKNKSLIGFAGAPWTLLLYMIHKQSPKNNFKKKQIFGDKYLLKRLISKLEDFICLHIDKQINAGANIIQIFDSWAGL